MVAETRACYRLAFHLTLNRADAEDLVQETFLKAWRSFDTFQPGTHARAWLFTILRHAYFERYRRWKRREPEIADSDIGDIDEWYLHDRLHDAEFQHKAVEPEEVFFSALTSDWVALAIAGLRPEVREAFVLADLEGFSYREISEIVGIPVGTVMSRLYRARHQLQRALWDYCLRTGQVRTPAATPPRLPQPPECREACRQIYRYLDKALDAAALAAIDSHLRRCRMCCNKFEFQRRLAAMICEVQGTVEVPARFRAQIRAVVERFSAGIADAGRRGAPTHTHSTESPGEPLSPPHTGKEGVRGVDPRGPQRLIGRVGTGWRFLVRRGRRWRSFPRPESHRP